MRHFLKRYFLPAATVLGIWLLGVVPLALLKGCSSTGAGVGPAIAKLLPVLETFADAAVRLHLTAVVQERAPALFAILDANNSGEITLAEIRAADLTDPVLVTVVLLTVERLVR